MSYNYKNKSTFSKMGNQIIPNNKKEVKLPKVNYAKELKDWQDGWFKGHYNDKNVCTRNESKR
tara:strand:+ start:446 stop:634 length:189 start_codon:yes stop_codon:yes gene_type:complete